MPVSVGCVQVGGYEAYLLADEDKEGAAAAEVYRQVCGWLMTCGSEIFVNSPPPHIAIAHHQNASASSSWPSSLQTDGPPTN